MYVFLLSQSGTFSMIVFTFVCFLCHIGSSVATQKSITKSSGHPVFFLQDPADGSCLSGDVFKRCSIDTLWHVMGKPGMYKIQKRLIDLNFDVENSCLIKEFCHLEDSSVGLGSCNHCGASKWNILGDENTGYVLTEDNNTYCIKRNGELAVVTKCDKGYSGFALQFATTDDISIMSGPGVDFIVAAANNDMETLQLLLTKHVSVNARDWDNRTALVAASEMGHLDVVRFLVERDADVDSHDKSNVSALMLAASHGHLNVVQFLVNVGAQIDATSRDGTSALWLAAKGGYNDIVSFLLEAGGSPHTQRKDGTTSLMSACTGGHYLVIRSLLAAGADVHTKDKDGLTALISASEQGSESIVEILLNYHSDTDVMTATGFSPLIIASAYGHLNVVKMLVENGAKLEIEHVEGVSPLMYAAAGGFVDLVAFLVLKGAAVNKRHKQGGSAFMEAASAGDVTIIEILLNAGADPFVIDDDGVTTVMSAASQGHIQICRKLLDIGVEINYTAKSGGTALMFASGGGHDAICQLLLERGADVNMVVQASPDFVELVAKSITDGKEDVEPHKNGVSALMLAVQGDHKAVVKTLVECGADLSLRDDEHMTALLYAVKGHFEDLTRYLLLNGADPTDVFVDEKGMTHNLLMDAVITLNTGLALLLIDKGAEVLFADDEGVTILTQASFLGMVEVVHRLLSAGVDISPVNSEGVNALIAAASEGHAEIVLMLLTFGSGSDVNCKDKDGTTALMAASVRGHVEVAKVLIEHGAGVNAQNVDGHTALMFAHNGKAQVETLLHKYGAFLDSGNDSVQLIHEALRTHTQIVQLLLNNKADAKIQDLEGHIAEDFDFAFKNRILVDNTENDL